MRKLLIIAVISFFCVSSACAQVTPAFTFVWDLLGFLKICKIAFDYEVTQRGEPVWMMEQISIAQENFKKARQLLEQYPGNDDIHIRNVAASSVNAIDMALYSTSAFFEKIDALKGIHPGGFENVGLDLTKFSSQMRVARKEMFNSVLGLLPVLIRDSQNAFPRGSIPFIISQEERQKLLARIEELFSDMQVSEVSSVLETVMYVKRLLEARSYDDLPEH